MPNTSFLALFLMRSVKSGYRLPGRMQNLVLQRFGPKP